MHPGELFISKETLERTIKGSVSHFIHIIEVQIGLHELRNAVRRNNATDTIYEEGFISYFDAVLFCSLIAVYIEIERSDSQV